MSQRHLFTTSAFLMAISLCGSNNFSTAVYGQGSEAATRQYAAASGFQNQKLYDAAIDEWQTFLRKYPSDARATSARHYLGTCCLQEKRYDDAIKALKEVARNSKFEFFEQTLLNLGIAHYAKAQSSDSKRDYAEAEKTLGQMLTRFPNSEFAPRALYYRAEALFQIDEASNAADAFRQLTTKYPTSEFASDALYGLGTALESSGKKSEASRTFADFVKRFPNNKLVTEIRMRQADLLFASEKYSQAEPVFAAVAAKTEFELADVAMLRQARCLYEQDKLVEAGRLYWNVPRTFRKTKHYDDAILSGAKCYFLAEKYSLARDGLEKLVGGKSKEAREATQWLARCHLKEGNPEQAVKVAERALDRSRKPSPELELVLIDALYEIPRQRSRAGKSYAKFAKSYPDHELAAQAQYMAALASVEAKNYEQAKNYCRQYLAKFDNAELKADVLFLAAESELLLDNHKAAIPRYQQFIKAAPRHSNAQRATVRMALAMLLDKQPQQAASALQPVMNSIQDPQLRSEALSVMGRSLVQAKDFKNAISVLRQALENSKDKAQKQETRIILAEAFRELGNNAEADRQLEQMLNEAGSGELAAEASYRLAESAYANEQFDDAVRFYTASAKQDPKGQFAAHAEYGIGWTLFNQGEYRRSIDAMTKLISKHRREKVAARGYYVRAMAAYQLNDYEPAIKDVDAFLKSNPKPADKLDAMYVQGLAYGGLKDTNRAVSIFEQILSAGGYEAADKVAYELGWTLLDRKDTNGAVKAFQRLATDFPKSPLAAEASFLVGESWYEAEQFAKAADAYKTSANAAATDEIAEKSLHKLGWCRLKTDDPDAAMQAFQAQLAKFPSGELSGDALFLVGESAFQNKDWQTAQQAYEQVAAKPNSTYRALAAFRAGECAAARSDWRGSGRWHKQVLDSYRDFEMLPEARYGYAWALQNEGRMSEAMKLYEQVTEETDTETAAKARFMIGECLFATKKHKEATRHFLKAAFLYNHPEWSPMAYFEAARCFEVLQDVDQAKSCYQKVVDKYPQHSKAADARKRLAKL